MSIFVQVFREQNVESQDQKMKIVKLSFFQEYHTCTFGSTYILFIIKDGTNSQSVERLIIF